MSITPDRTAGFTDSVIRRMTRISNEYGAVNLSQGFPDFDPPKPILDRLAAVSYENFHQYSITWGSDHFRQALAAKQSALAYEQQMYAVAEKKYQLGNLSANALQDAKDTLDSAQRDVEAAQLDLFTAYHSYDQAVKLGLISSSNG